MPDIRNLFAEGGALDRELDDYRPRQGQVEMAQRVQEVLAEGRGQCVLEAGTGIGKTFAYLAPIILSGKKALISTGARNLQDQLVLKDIPRLTKALGRDVSVAVLKGRANYICKKRMEEDNVLPGMDDHGDWAKIRMFAVQDSEGDVGRIPEVPADSRLLGRAVSTRETCNTKGCPHYEGCFLYKARKRAHGADIVIVNHHLFLSDVRLREEGVAELLPQREVVLFDEAHVLPELAPDFFGVQVSGAHFTRLLTELERAAKKAKQKDDSVISASKTVRGELEKWQEWSNAHTGKGGTIDHAQMLADKQWVKATKSLAESVEWLAQVLKDKDSDDDELRDALRKFSQRLFADCDALRDWLQAGSGANGKAAPAMDEEGFDPIVRWAAADDSSGNLTLHSAPMTGRNLFKRQWREQRMLFFTSATLSVGGDFKDFCDAAGLEDSQTHSWDSPYDFAERTRLYLPPNMPDPRGGGADAHTEAAVKAALPLIVANGGRAFMLFTSWRALRAAHPLLQPQLQKENITVLKQRDMSNDKLLKRFRREERAVLVGTKSFWQGVDVPGEALSLVVVDKLPFTPPTDPILIARDEWCEERGENPFMRNQLPRAVLLMKQVAGRLIRHHDDYGIFMIADPRVLTKGYGKTVIKALPPMPPCRDAKEAEDFLRQWAARRARANEATEVEPDEWDELEEENGDDMPF